MTTKHELARAFISAKRSLEAAKEAEDAARKMLSSVMKAGEEISTDIGKVKKVASSKRVVDTDKVAALYRDKSISRGVWEGVAPRTAKVSLLDAAVETGRVDADVLKDCVTETPVTQFRVTK